MHRIDWSLIIYFYTDASQNGAGLVITQFQGIPTVEVLVLYDAFTFNITERKYPTYKKELYAIVKFSTKYDYILRHSNIKKAGIIHTDHKLLVNFLKSDLYNGIYGNWAAKMRQLNAKIEHIKDIRNTVADGLSRTLFRQEDCEENKWVLEVTDQFNAHGSKWIWKDGKDGFEEFFASLNAKDRAQVIGTGQLHRSSVFALIALEGSMWAADYRSSKWFSAIYQFHDSGVLPEV